MRIQVTHINDTHLDLSDNDLFIFIIKCEALYDTLKCKSYKWLKLMVQLLWISTAICSSCSQWQMFWWLWRALHMWHNVFIAIHSAKRSINYQLYCKRMYLCPFMANWRGKMPYACVSFISHAYFCPWMKKECSQLHHKKTNKNTTGLHLQFFHDLLNSSIHILLWSGFLL